MARIYRNTAGSFADINAGFEGVQNATVSWVDYDNDGDLDAFTAGQANCCGAISRLYTNQNGTFVNSGASIQGMYQASAAWGDYDNDGDHDLLMSGIVYCCSRGTLIYRNDGGSLSFIGSAGLEAPDQGTVAWGDYDNDGDLDVLMVGYANCCGRFARVYRNQGGTFSDIGAGLEGVYDTSSAAWGDFDNDGDLDIALSGYADGLGAISRIYANQAGTFTHIDAGLEGMQRSAAAWGDYDQDGDLDLFLTGLGSSARIARLYRNNATTPNTPPAPPTGLDVSVVLGGAATFSWSPSTDAQTPSPALTYNLRVGTTPGGSEVSASMAAADGTRRVVQLGNANHRTSWGIPLSSIPLTSRIYFSVQALDHSFAGSPFSEERAFGALPTIQSVTDVGNDQGRQVRVRWEKSFLDAQGASPSVTGYAIWRRVDAFKPAESEPIEPLRAALPPGDWDYLVTVPARGDDYYNVVVPTLCDSTIDGVCYSAFFVSGLTSIPTTFFDSAPDSGYSIDNLSPSIPLGLMASLSSPSEATLTWNEGSDADLRHYVVYRSPTPGFMPVPALRVGYASEPNFQDALYGPGTYYYRVTAVDFAGNESAPSMERFVTTTATDVAAPPARDELHAAQPNPFNPSTTIVYELAAPSDITIAIYDARGTRIATLLATRMPAGRHTVVWDGTDDRGRGVRSGAYFCKLTSKSFHAEQKLTLLR
jgi:hypothetical protein